MKTYNTLQSGFLALAGSMLIVTPALAAAAKPDAPAEIIVTAPLESARIDSLQGAEVLKREEIVATLNGGIGTTLSALPGIATSYFGAGASRPIIRGLGEDRVLVLQNGIGAIDASTASPDHAVTSDGLDAERIEILRGAAALAYGGNAIGGVVNVIDQSIPTRRVDGIKGHALATLNSVDDGREGALDATTGLGPLVLRGAVSARETEDYETPIGTTPNSWTKLRTFGVGASFVGAESFAGLAANRTETEYGLLPEAPGEPGGRIDLEQTRIEARGDAKVSFGPIDRIDFATQHADYTHTEYEADGKAGTRFESQGWEARFEAHHTLGALKGAVGVQASDADLEALGDEAFIPPSQTRKAGVFAVERFDRQRWGLEGGVRLDRTEIESAIAPGRTFNASSLSIGAFARPAEGWFAGVNVAKTERAPSAVELYADGAHVATRTYEIGDDGLKPETARSIEASVRYAKTAWGFEVNLYHVDFSDYIALVNRGDVQWSDEDAGVEGFAASADDPSIPPDASILPIAAYVQKDARFTGGEISATAKLFDLGPFAVGGRASLDVVRAEFASGGALPRIPPRTARVRLTADSDSWSGSLEAVDVGAQDRAAEFETTTKGYTMLNAGLAWRPSGRDGAITVRLDGRNLTDELGRVHTSFLKDETPLPGRSIRLAVTADF